MITAKIPGRIAGKLSKIFARNTASRIPWFGWIRNVIFGNAPSNSSGAMTFPVQAASSGDLVFHHVGLVMQNQEAARRYCEKLNLPVLAEDFVEAFSCDVMFVG